MDRQATERETLGTQRKFFTPAEANRSLVLVQRIVADIAARYRALLDVRADMDRYQRAPAPGGRLEDLQRRAEQLTDELTRLQDELIDVGCELKDWAAGLVDFPALHRGREVLLCWKLGEPSVSHWHEVDAGFAGRQPIAEDF